MADAPMLATAQQRARAYFTLQAGSGALWWVAVGLSDRVRRSTLGGWDPLALLIPDLVLFVGTSAVAAAFGSRRAAAVAALWTSAVTIALATYGLVERAAGWGIVGMAMTTAGSAIAASAMWFGHVPTAWFFIGPFSFRPAGRARRGSHLRRSLTQLVIFWTTFFVTVPSVLTTLEGRLRISWPALRQDHWDDVGATVFVWASALGLWSCVTMAVRGEGTPLPAATARSLVLAGPYRYVRNPMALAGALQTASVGVMLGSWTTVVIAIAGAVSWNVFIRPVEEADLAARFGDDYASYCSTIRCWIPSVPSPRRTLPR